MALFKKKNKNDNAFIPDDNMSVDDVMRKYDRESNTRIWEGTPKIVIRCIMAAFSLFCIYVTLIGNFLEQTRLTSSVGLIIVMGYLNYPATKKNVKVNYIPWYDIVLMVLGAGAFLYYAFNAMDIVKMSYGGVAKNPMLIVIAIIGLISLIEFAAEVC